MNHARRDLCGGHPAMDVPTAIIIRKVTTKEDVEKKTPYNLETHNSRFSLDLTLVLHNLRSESLWPHHDQI